MIEYDNSGNSPFQVRTDRDYSGVDAKRARGEGLDLSRSFFNGANLQDCIFYKTALNNSEFSEALLEKTTFDICDLSAADFVGSQANHVRFDSCDISHGEWRNAKFTKCAFISCNFDHTTITLCTFIDCIFDDASVISMEHRAIYHNVFSSCKFDRPFTHSAIISKNFGVIAASEHRELIKANSPNSIEQLCYLSNFDAFSPIIIVNFIETYCGKDRESHRNDGSIFSFLTIIIAALGAEGRISAPALICIEDMLGHYASSLDDQSVFMIVMGCILQIRNALYELSEVEFVDCDPAHALFVERVQIYYAASYTHNDALALCEALAEAAGSSDDGLTLDHFSIGSTLIELGVTAAITTASLLSAVNLILRQATTTVKQVSELKRAVIALVNDEPRKKPRLPASRKQTSKVPAILNRSNVSPKLTPIRNSVRKNGRKLITMDDKATVTIFESENQ